MKKQQVAQILREIAERDVPANLNLWPAIRARIQPQRSSSHRMRLMPTTRLGWASVALILCLIFGTVTYAVAPFVARLFQQEAGLRHIAQTDLVQDINLSQTIEGVTVTLERAYADANRIVVGFTVIGPDDQRYDPHRVTLSDANGTVFPLMSGLGATGQSDLFDLSLPPGEGAYVLAFDAAAVEGTPAELDLQLGLEVEKLTPSSDASNSFLTSARPPIEKPSDKVVELKPLPTPAEEDIVGTFTFAFSVPFNAGHIIKVRQTVESAGVAMRLEKVVVTPSETRAILCFEPPDRDGVVWTLVAALDVGDGQELFGGIVKPTENLNEECHCVIYPHALADQPGLWTLTVTELVGTDLRQQPSEDIRVAGPWVFRFHVP